MSVLRTMSRAGSAVCIGLVRGYQLTLASVMGGHCRYHPSCSQYAIEAYREWGVIRGTWLAARRIGRCHPFGGHGFDPVPERKPIVDRTAENPLRTDANVPTSSSGSSKG